MQSDSSPAPSVPDALLATIENSLTAAERNLLELDEHQRVREIRMVFQHASECDS
jgi:uncharacterized protein YbcI